MAYVRYRQVAHHVKDLTTTMSASLSSHSTRINKASLIVGLAAAFGMNLVADFPVIFKVYC